MNKRFNKLYENDVTVITDGLTHGVARIVLETKVKQKLISKPVLVGYNDALLGVFDKHMTRTKKRLREYLMGIQAAINNGAIKGEHVEHADSLNKLENS